MCLHQLCMWFQSQAAAGGGKCHACGCASAALGEEEAGLQREAVPCSTDHCRQSAFQVCACSCVLVPSHLHSPCTKPSTLLLCLPLCIMCTAVLSLSIVCAASSNCLPCAAPCGQEPAGICLMRLQELCQLPCLDGWPVCVNLL